MFRSIAYRLVISLGMIAFAVAEAPAAAVKISGADLESWGEDATVIYYNYGLELAWRNRGGDWKPAVLGSVSLIDDDRPGEIRIPVIVPPSGAHFVLVRSGGANYVFHSREAANPAVRPTFKLKQATCAATRDVHLDKSTFKALGKNVTLSTRGNILIAFDDCDVKPGDRGEIVLHATGAKFGHQTITAHEPDPRLAVLAQPAWLPNDNTLIAEFDAKEIASENNNATISNGVAARKLSNGQLTWFSRHSALPGSPRTLACATVYLKLHDDFIPGSGGKLPGFANTGSHRRFASQPEIIGSKAYPNTAWGGRAPDGIHWSARTGYGRRTERHVATHTYFYARHPPNLWGYSEPLNLPLPKGKWAAYVQCIKMNTVSPGATTGNADGGLLYESPSRGITYVRNDIRWRDMDVPESLVRAFWHNVYCGGTSCGPNDPGTVSMARVTITAGRPDMSGVQAQVGRLNAADRAK